MPSSQIKIYPVTGPHLKTYLPSIAKLRLDVLRGYPDLYEGELEQEKRYLRKYLQCPDAIAVIVFDGSTIIGASTGLPLLLENKGVQKPLRERNMEIEKLFYFEESVLLPQYRGRGIGHHFFDYREDHVRKLKKFDAICFCSVDRPENHPKKPSDYLPLNDFWRKRGYIQFPEIKCFLSWKDVDEEKKTTKPLTFWMKSIHQGNRKSA